MERIAADSKDSVLMSADEHLSVYRAPLHASFCREKMTIDNTSTRTVLLT